MVWFTPYGNGNNQGNGIGCYFALQELRARLYEKLGQADQARDVYNELLQRNPDRREYYDGLARVNGYGVLLSPLRSCWICTVLCTYKFITTLLIFLIKIHLS